MKLDSDTKKNIGALIVLVVVSLGVIIIGYLSGSQIIRTFCYAFGMLLFLFAVLGVMYVITYSRAIRFARVKKTKFRFKEDKSK